MSIVRAIRQLCDACTGRVEHAPDQVVHVPVERPAPRPGLDPPSSPTAPAPEDASLSERLDAIRERRGWEPRFGWAS